jgi:cytochrome c
LNLIYIKRPGEARAKLNTSLNTEEIAMKIRIIAGLGAVLWLNVTAWAAQDTGMLLQKSHCMSCHALTTQSLGPSFKAVATKYQSDKGAQAKLEKKVRTGGKGSFGEMPMPATAGSVSEADIKQMVQWVLLQK